MIKRRVQKAALALAVSLVAWPVALAAPMLFAEEAQTNRVQSAEDKLDAEIGMPPPPQGEGQFHLSGEWDLTPGHMDGLLQDPPFTGLAITFVSQNKEVRDRFIPALPENAAEMAPPRDWTCELYVSEYRAWLDEGNAREDWRFSGKVYRDVETDEIYTVDTWRQWRAENDCPALAFADNEVLPAAVAPASTLMGSIISAAAAAATGAAILDDNNANSPG